MKLWLKLSLTAMIVLTLSAMLCGGIMLYSSGRSGIDSAVERALTDRHVRFTGWLNSMTGRVDTEYSFTAKRSLAKYLITKYADDGTVLLCDEDVIYNCSPIAPSDYLPLATDDEQYIIKDIGQRALLISGSAAAIDGERYRFYSVDDITDVYSSIKELSYRFTLVNFAVIVAGGMLSVILTRLILKPIATLKHTTGLIADGLYHNRAAVAENDEIGELAADFNAMADAVEKHIGELKLEAERRTMFTSALTHELKTPMTSIKGNAETLLATKLTEQERYDSLMAIDFACTRIERLSQKLMQLIVLRRAGELELKAESVTAVLEEAASACAEQLKARGQSISIACGVDTLLMEHDLLLDLIINLVDNASKASPSGALIELIAEDNRITVRDHGIGIPNEELDKLTEPFYMVDKSRSRRAGGAGIGLALCKEIATLHNAKLAFESEPGVGTSASIVFSKEEDCI